MKSRGLYISFRLIDGTGISKKIQVQQRCLCELFPGEFDYINIKIDGLYLNEENILKCDKKMRLRKYEYFLLHYLKDRRYDFIYIRYEMFASPLFMKFLKMLNHTGTKIVLEIPTYPYDGELEIECKQGNFKSRIKSFLKCIIEKKYRLKLKKYIYRFITFSDDEEIFNVKTVRITNGIDLNSIHPVQRKEKETAINIVGAAKLTKWHGFDRLLYGLSNYYSEKRKIEIYVTILGSSDDDTFDQLKILVNKLQLEEYVSFTGDIPYDQLEKYFENADLGLGSLGRHRSGNNTMASLKNREYAARGIPFFYSENDTFFDNKGYVYKIPADETAVDIDNVIKFYMDTRLYKSDDIRGSILELDWKNQMQKVLDNVLY